MESVYVLLCEWSGPAERHIIAVFASRDKAQKAADGRNAHTHVSAHYSVELVPAFGVKADDSA